MDEVRTLDTPKISVIVPVYKVEPYLRKCLDSIVNQTYRNLEILLVDDGSPDNCGAICDEYAAGDGRIRVIHQENKGVYMARNLALDVVSGAYIGFVDGDDWIEPTMYAELVSLLETSATADIAQCEMYNDGPPQLRQIFLGKEVIYHTQSITRAIFRDEIGHALINKLFRSRFWTTLRFQGNFYHEDAMVITRFAGQCGGVIRTDQMLYHYNTTNSSITRGSKNLLHVESMETLFDIYEEAARQIGPEGAFYLCREIPSAGRQIWPSKEISMCIALSHLRYMHKIFKRNWAEARQAEAYAEAPKAKKSLWHIYKSCPIMAFILVHLYAKVK